MQRHVLWLNTYASFIGGCEHYIYNTVFQLKLRGIRSFLLYDPNQVVTERFIRVFAGAYPCVSLDQQLREIEPTAVYVHQHWNEADMEVLAHSPYPVLRFYHDHYLFCLRKHKTTTLTKSPCSRPVSWKCYPCLGFVNAKEDRKGITIRRLKDLYRQRRLDKQWDGWVVGSHYMHKQLLDAGYDACKTHILPLYATQGLPDVPKKRESCVLLFVGQLLPGKGLDLLLRALSGLDLSYQLVIAGSGPWKANYRQLASELGLNSHLTFLGKVGQARLQSLYQQATAVVFPVQAPETFGLVGPEAMRWGTPVIASDLGGICEWLEHEVTGLRVPHNDVDALREAVYRVLTAPQWAKELGENARQCYRDRFVPEQHMEGLMALLTRLSPPPKGRNSGPFGRFTLSGSALIEQKIENLVEEVSHVVQSLVPTSHCRALVLIGGYGKGEGGVEYCEGEERPHNNLDFICVLRSSKRVKALQKDLDCALMPLREREGVGIDLSVISETKLRYASPLLIWYEMVAGGSKTIFGDKDFVRSLPLGDMTRIPATEFSRLMVNRGTLLLINLWMNDKGLDSPSHRRSFLKHIMKAIIGFGDALLYYHGDYHWSYLKKSQRLQQRWDVPEEFRKLYAEATAFRFCPNYSTYDGRDLVQWSKNLLSLFTSLYLRCESMRTACTELCWDDYLRKALSLEGNSQWVNPRSLLRKAYSVWHRPRGFVGLNWAELWGFCCSTPAKRLDLVFPVVAFDVGCSSLRQQVAMFLGASSPDSRDMREAFLRLWAESGDSNFSTFLKQHEMSV